MVVTLTSTVVGGIDVLGFVMVSVAVLFVSQKKKNETANDSKEVGMATCLTAKRSLKISSDV